MKNKTTKLFAILLVVLLFCLLFAGCNNAYAFTDEDYENLEIFTVNTTEGSSAISIEKYPLWSNDSPLLSSEKAPPKTMAVEFDGKTYTGEFVNSTVNVNENYRTDTYQGENGRYFEVNAKTGELTSISFKVQEGKDAVSEDKREKVALELAEKYIDTGKYKMTTSESDVCKHYCFRKQLDGLKSGREEFCEDWLRIGVTKYGQVVSFESCMLGAYPDRLQDLPDQTQERLHLLCSEGAKEKVLAQVKEAKKDSKNAKISVVDAVQWVLLEDGTWGVIYGVKVESESTPIEIEPGVYAEFESDSSVTVLVK